MGQIEIIQMTKVENRTKNVCHLSNHEVIADKPIRDILQNIWPEIFKSV